MSRASLTLAAQIQLCGMPLAAQIQLCGMPLAAQIQLCGMPLAVILNGSSLLLDDFNKRLILTSRT